MQDIVTDDIKKIVSDIRNLATNLENKNILLVGGRGFLGTYFLKTLMLINEELTKKMKIYVVDNLITAKNIENVKFPHVSFIESDISKNIEIPDKVDFIIHSASIASPPVYRKYPLKTIDVNYQGTRNILEIAKANSTLSVLYISSSEIYGDPATIPTPESYWGNVSCTGPRACYDESKRLAETCCMTYFTEYGIPVKIVRPFNVYGPYLSLDDGRVIPDFFKNAIMQSKIVIYSDGTPTRSFCYVSDAIRAFFKVLLIGQPGSIYNVGNDEEISINGLAEKIAEIAKPVDLIFEKSQDKNYTTDNPQRRCPDLTKIKKELDYLPIISLDEGLRRLYSWYKGELE